MKRPEFIKLVVDEIENVKNKATKEEKSKLDKRTFDKNKIHLCIYGQLTGGCVSKRAQELSPKIFRNYTDLDEKGKGKTFSSHSFESGSYATALEKYLYMATEKQQFNIIDYIKGDTQTLNIK